MFVRLRRLRAAVARYGRAHRQAALDTYLFLVRRSLGSLVVWVMIGASLALPTGLYLASYNLAGVQSQWAARPAVTVFFTPELSSEGIRQLQQKLADVPGVASLVFVSANEALRDMSARLSLKDDLAALGSNPLPASALVTTTPDADLAALSARLRSLPGVDQIVLERAWLERLAAITQLMTRLSWLAGGLLALTAALVAGSAVRLAIDERLEEVLVLRLVGATDGQIRRPFLYLGLWYGLGGGVLSALVLSLALEAIAGPMLALSASYGAQMHIVGFDLPLVLALVSTGAVLGVLGAAVSARRSAQARLN